MNWQHNFQVHDRVVAAHGSIAYEEAYGGDGTIVEVSEGGALKVKWDKGNTYWYDNIAPFRRIGRAANSRNLRSEVTEANRKVEEAVEALRKAIAHKVRMELALELAQNKED